jgi:polysaccharide export outer membrane protein
MMLLSPGSAPAQVTDYLVGPQDVLTIALWDQPDLGGKYAVEADGTFTFPLIGRIKAGGLTMRELEVELKRRLADGYFKNPQVSVAIESYRSQRVFVVGEVRSPGTYSLTGEMTLIEALARAGSTTQNASGEALVVRTAKPGASAQPVLPGQPGASDVIRVDIKELQSGALSQNLPLRDGDTIFLPRADMIYVFGQVRNPGAYALQQKDTSVLMALSLAGGVTDRGSTGRIKVVRLVGGEKKELKVVLGDSVQPADTIIVMERFF